MSTSFVPPTFMPSPAPAVLEAEAHPVDRVVLAGGVEWRSTARHLWVGRDDGQHAGIIEHGRNYRFTDADGNFRGTFHSLEQAMEAAGHADDLPIVEVGGVERWSRAQLSATVAGVAAVALLAVGMLLR